MQSWAENLGGGRTEPQGDEAAPAGGEPVVAYDQAAQAGGEAATADDQAVAADDQPVSAADRAAAAGDQPVSAHDFVVIVTDDQDAPDDQDATAAADDEGDTAEGEAEPDLAAITPAGAAAAGGSPSAFAGSHAADAPGEADIAARPALDASQPLAAPDDEGDTAEGEPELDLAALVPAGAAPAGGSPSAFAGGHADDAAAGEAGIGGRRAPDASQSCAEEATPDSTAGFSPEPGPAQGADSVSAAGRWTEIQAMFVDDPRASVELAADLVDDSLEAFVASARQLQGSLRSTWGGSDADTEQLRKALQHYRAFWRHLHSISIEP